MVLILAKQIKVLAVRRFLTPENPAYYFPRRDPANAIGKFLRPDSYRQTAAACQNENTQTPHSTRPRCDLACNQGWRCLGCLEVSRGEVKVE
jgi:hypothetical protein